MTAVVIEGFGGIEALQTQTIQVPQIRDDQVLLRVHTAGIGAWDKFEREGMFAQFFGTPLVFPYVLGSEGAGTIVKIGDQVDRFHVGQKVFGLVTHRSPKAGFYAQYVAVDADKLWPIPANLSLGEAGVIASNGGTALRGLRDILKVEAGDEVLIFGAGGGMGHIGVQLAKAMGAMVFAVASGEDGVELALRMGADKALDGRKSNALEALDRFSPAGLVKALVTGGGEAASLILSHMPPGGRVAVPNGVYPLPHVPTGVELVSYNAEYDDELMVAFCQLVGQHSIQVHVAQSFALSEAKEAHSWLDKHHLGRLAFELPA